MNVEVYILFYTLDHILKSDAVKKNIVNIDIRYDALFITEKNVYNAID